MKQKVIEVNGELFIPFKWMDDTSGGGNLGRAEFTVCIKTSRVGVAEFWVTPSQQRDLRDIVWRCRGRDTFMLCAYEGLDDPKVWLVQRCNEHKCTAFQIYAPSEAKYICISVDGVSFTRTDWSCKG